MHSLAKRVYAIAPDPVRLTFADGTAVTLSVDSAEFFQEQFQGEGHGDDGYAYRLVSDGADDPLVAGRQLDDGWRLVGEVTEVVAVESAP
ncbi:MAG: hypothetical protein ABEJ23_07670 [Haloarculaceae archaeon]